MNNFIIKLFTKLILILTILLVTGCSNSGKLFKKVDSRKVPVNVDDRIKKNLAEGRGFKLSNLGKNSNTYDFATSNELWRASLSVLDFIPLLNADYSGGIIITDWYQEEDSKNSIKITVRFLSNEIRVDGLDVLVYKKNCAAYESCAVQTVKSDLSGEIKIAILKKATVLKKEKTAKNVKKRKKILGDKE